MKKVNYINPEEGVIYHNRGGGDFVCVDSYARFHSFCPLTAVMKNIRSGWTFLAHGVQQYEDGTIEWDYSTKGHFE